MNAEAIFEAVDKELWGVWFLIGAALVFFMQCGFAMVETGFTRAKNAGNIIMKNLMDFCIGTVVFILIGFGLFLGEDMVGLIGKPGLDIFTAYENFDYSNFVFNLVFCATAATIVSGAMAERTKFLSYCVYSGVISALIYPVEAHWIWGGGWLAQLGFHDFAGSTAIHMVGGLSALIGAKILGPRIGKFETDKDGKVTKVNAIPGHSLTLGALGVFILWFGWYGFNGAAAKSIDQLGSVFNHHRTCHRNRNLHDLYMAQVRQAGCFHVSERIPGWSGRRNRSLRRGGLPGRIHHRYRFRSAGGIRRMAPGLQAPHR